MELPDVWILLGNHLHQDFLIDYPNFYPGFIDIFQDFSKNEKVELLNFINSLISSNLNDRELMKTWADSGSQIYFQEETMRDTLEEILKILTESMK